MTTLIIIICLLTLSSICKDIIKFVKQFDDK